AGQHAGHPRAVEPHDRRDPLERRADRRLSARQHRYGVARHVLGDDFAVPVGDDAARRRKGNGAQSVRLGLELVFPVLKDLGPEERDDQHGDGGPQNELGDPEAPRHEMRVECRHASPSRIASSRRNIQSTTTPTSAVVRLCIGDQTSSSHPSMPPFTFPEKTATIRFRNHVPAKNRQPFTNRFSAKNTALLQAERYPTSVWASAPAPNDAGVSASRSSPTRKPTPALGPGAARIV